MVGRAALNPLDYSPVTRALFRALAKQREYVRIFTVS